MQLTYTVRMLKLAASIRGKTPRSPLTRSNVWSGDCLQAGRAGVARHAGYRARRRL
jgi:hypothetical protein